MCQCVFLCNHLADVILRKCSIDENLRREIVEISKFVWMRLNEFELGILLLPTDFVEQWRVFLLNNLLTFCDEIKI